MNEIEIKLLRGALDAVTLRMLQLMVEYVDKKKSLWENEIGLKELIVNNYLIAKKISARYAFDSDTNRHNFLKICNNLISVEAIIEYEGAK